MKSILKRAPIAITNVYFLQTVNLETTLKHKYFNVGFPIISILIPILTYILSSFPGKNKTTL